VATTLLYRNAVETSLSMTLLRPLTVRVHERDALLNHITSVLRADERIGALWLFGSLGRGAGDAVSDLDIWVVVHEAYLPTLLVDVYAIAALVGEPMFVLEAPYNGPSGGTSINTAYDGEQTGAHLVDWYFQSASTAHLPVGTPPLFDWVGLPVSAENPTFGNPGKALSETAGKVQNIRFFWQMLLVCAKYVYRSPNEERMGLLPYVVNALNDVRQFVGQPSRPDANDLPAHHTPGDKLALLRDLAEDMAACMPAVERIAQEQNESWQIAPTIIPSAYRFLGFIEDALHSA
jgi:predicted nucleotidyltransferase